MSEDHAAPDAHWAVTHAYEPHPDPRCTYFTREDDARTHHAFLLEQQEADAHRPEGVRRVGLWAGTWQPAGEAPDGT